MKRRIVYLFLIAGTFYLLIMYAARVFLLLLLLELLFPLFQLLLLWFQAAGLRGRWEEAGGTVRFVIENKGILPFLNLSVRIVLHHPWSKTVRTFRRNVTVSGRHRQELVFQPEQLPCGRSEIQIDRLRLRDYLGLFSVKKRVNFSRTFRRVPDLVPVELSVSGRTWSFRADGEIFSKEKPGEDPAEVFGLREYQPGDRLQRVHWKLSARSEEWMVKELSLAVIPRVLFLLDLHRTSDITMEQSNAYLTAALSISHAIAWEGCCHEIGWYLPEQKSFAIYRIEESEQVLETAEQLMEAELYEESVDLWELCHAEGRAAKYAGILRLTLGMELWYGEERVGTLSFDDIKESLAHCGLEV
ncbi:DUF58 domain-containing protein [Hominifimenecus sp. rT4P-3]|uniref:DUF58 domain-containing protein n=1 Tax=Hominifimenecus sp. rT4P-3 TaxID=3242979 RepID=UPI003DA1E63C